MQIKCIDASSLQESVRDALRGCGQDLGEEWRRTRNNWAISLVLALWSWIRTQPFTLADVIEMQLSNRLYTLSGRICF